MSDEKEKLDILLDANVKAVMDRVDWQSLNNGISARLDEADRTVAFPATSRWSAAATHHWTAYKIAAAVLIIAGVIFAAFTLRHGERPRSVQHGHATLLAQPASGRAVVTINYGRDAVAVVRTVSFEPTATCKLEIIDLEKYGYKHYKGASYTIVVMKTIGNY